MRIGVGVVLVASGVLLLVGLWRLKRSRSWGSGMVAACAVPLGICFWWTGVAPVLSLVAVVVGIWKSRKRARVQVVELRAGEEDMQPSPARP